MKVLMLHIGDYHNGGGGGVAMHRLYLAYQQAGIESKILCGSKTIQSPDISRIPRMPKIERPFRAITSRLGLNDIHLVGSFKVKDMEVYRQADILDFHGTHSNTLSYLALPTLTEDKPAVFTLHDMWALTGHCVYSYDCNRWQIGCGKCPYPDTYPAIKRDNTRLEWKLKDWIYSRSNLTIVAVSKWLTGLAKQSMLQRFPIHYIPNGVDTDIYKPLDPNWCRSLLGIPAGKKVLMFGALNLKNFRKGGDLLLKALKNMPTELKNNIVLLTLGRAPLLPIENIQTIDLGFISNDRIKAICYSAADLFIHPTRAENLPLVLLESMACGTPMVSFNVGGVPELIRSGITGYLAEPENAEDLCSGIIQLLEDETRYRYMSQQCRAIALEEYTLKLQVQRYIELYRRLLPNSVIQTPSDEEIAVNSFSNTLETVESNVK